MRFRSLALSFVGFCALLAPQAVHAAPPVQSDWNLTCTRLIGDPVPFTASQFHFIQSGALVQAQNTPLSGEPQCSMVGTVSGTLFVGTEACGTPRNSDGIVIGLLGSTTFDSIWIDSLGIYRVSGTKVVPSSRKK
jgi:hypothetical protein